MTSTPTSPVQGSSRELEVVPNGELEVVPNGVRDAPTVFEDGRRRPAIDGVVAVPATIHADHRGSLMEAVNFDDEFWVEPVVYAYTFTVASGRIKGWGMHKVQADRYVVLPGTLRVVLYDGRPASPTFERFSVLCFGDQAGFIRIPPGVWHADQNFGETATRVINFPTHRYDHENPDKHRIDPASGEIPFDFTLRDG